MMTDEEFHLLKWKIIKKNRRGKYPNNHFYKNIKEAYKKRYSIKVETKFDRGK